LGIRDDKSGPLLSQKTQGVEECLISKRSPLFQTTFKMSLITLCSRHRGNVLAKTTHHNKPPSRKRCPTVTSAQLPPLLEERPNSLTSIWNSRNFLMIRIVQLSENKKIGMRLSVLVRKKRMRLRQSSLNLISRPKRAPASSWTTQR
jgi:hypothetical protein